MEAIQEEYVVGENEWVVSKQVSGHLRIVRAGPTGSIKMKKKLVSTAAFAGEPYGSVFDVVAADDADASVSFVREELGKMTKGSKKRKLKEIVVCKMVRRADDAPSEFAGTEAKDATQDSIVEDNRNLVDCGDSAQALNADDILKLRAEAKGDEIVEALVKGSGTFKTKTAFSREKYLKQKKKVHRSIEGNALHAPHGVGELLEKVGIAWAENGWRSLV